MNKTSINFFKQTQMKTYDTFAKWILLIMPCLFILAACQKSIQQNNSDTQEPDINTQKKIEMNSMNISNTSQSDESEMFNLVMENEASDLDEFKQDCPERTFIPSRHDYPHTVIIDYGSGCTDKFGRVKKGKLMITYSAPMTEPGAVSVTTFENFSIDDAKIDGRHVIEHLAPTTDNFPHFSHLANRTVQYPDGTSSDEVSNKLYVQTEGGNTSQHKDDGFTIFGESTGKIYAFGFHILYAAKINNNDPLHNSVECEFSDKGSENSMIYLGQKLLINAKVDYGDGNCNNDAIVTSNNLTVHVKLPLEVWPF